MGCGCSLPNTLRRLYPGISEELLTIAQMVDKADKDSHEFQTHIDIEDEYIREHLKSTDQRIMDQAHRRFRACYALGRSIDPVLFRNHGAWEAQLFITLGRAA